MNKSKSVYDEIRDQIQKWAKQEIESTLQKLKKQLFRGISNKIAQSEDKMRKKIATEQRAIQTPIKFQQSIIHYNDVQWTCQKDIQQSQMISSKLSSQVATQTQSFSIQNTKTRQKIPLQTCQTNISLNDIMRIYHKQSGILQIKYNQRLDEIKKELDAIKIQVNAIMQDSNIQLLKKKKNTSLINFASAMINKFKFQEDENIFQIKMFQKKNFQLLGSIPIKEKPFQCEILCPSIRGIGIGIIDPQYYQDQNSLWSKRRNLICLRLSNGAIYQSGKQVAKRNLEVVPKKIKVIICGNRVIWAFDGKQTVQFKSDLLEFPIVWVGLVLMGYQGDKIKLI